MNILRHKLLLPAALAAGSFLFMIIFMGLTNPINKIAYAIVFFTALLLFMVSLGYLGARLHSGEVLPKTRYRIWITSLLILITVMLRSAQSLNAIDLVVVVLIGFGLVFYSSHRP